MHGSLLCSTTLHKRERVNDSSLLFGDFEMIQILNVVLQIWGRNNVWLLILEIDTSKQISIITQNIHKFYISLGTLEDI
jgi:hypothetical protein